jgi:hypothetical protein
MAFRMDQRGILIDSGMTCVSQSYVAGVFPDWREVFGAVNLGHE